jgi:glycosyltransferase involved in cell wall biosynthesis
MIDLGHPRFNQTKIPFKPNISSMMISVVIPMYNSAESILRSIGSVLNQTYKGTLEIIVVNDGSTDNSLKVVEDYICANNITNVIVVNKQNGGVSSARNAGMKQAKGDFIALLDSDDEWGENKLARQIEVLTDNPQITLLGCNRNNEVVSSFAFKRFSRLTPISARLLLLKNFFPTPTVIFRREILQTIGFFDELQRFAEEGNYWIRICSKESCALLNESHIITGGGKPDFGHSGLSANLLEMEKGELKNIKLALKLNIINYVEFLLLNVYSVTKYLRRLIIVNLR